MFPCVRVHRSARSELYTPASASQPRKSPTTAAETEGDRCELGLPKRSSHTLSAVVTFSAPLPIVLSLSLSLTLPVAQTHALSLLPLFLSRSLALSLSRFNPSGKSALSNSLRSARFRNGEAWLLHPRCSRRLFNRCPTLSLSLARFYYFTRRAISERSS